MTVAEVYEVKARQLTILVVETFEEIGVLEKRLGQEVVITNTDQSGARGTVVCIENLRRNCCGGAKPRALAIAVRLTSGDVRGGALLEAAG